MKDYKVYKYRRRRVKYACAGCKFYQNLMCTTVTNAVDYDMQVAPDNFGTPLAACFDYDGEPLILEDINK